MTLRDAALWMAEEHAVESARLAMELPYADFLDWLTRTEARARRKIDALRDARV